VEIFKLWAIFWGVRKLGKKGLSFVHWATYDFFLIEQLEEKLRNL
jgi:hypothetical protein